MSAELVLGTAQWGSGYGITNSPGRITDAEVAEIVQTARDGGIRAVDTHRAQREDQGYGDAQRRLAPWAREFSVTTKVFGGIGIPVRAQLEQNLAELTVPAVATCLVHDWMSLTDAQAASTANALSALVEEGLCRHAGVAAYDAQDIRRAHEYFGPHAALQVPASVLDQRLVADDEIQALLSSVALVHVRGVFAQGLLLPHDPATAWSDHPDLIRWRRDPEIARIDPIAACLAFARHLPWADGIVVGVVSAAQLRAIIDAWQSAVPVIDWRRFASADVQLLDPRRWPR